MYLQLMYICILCLYNCGCGGGLSTSIVSSGWGWEWGSWGRVVGMGEEGGGFCCLAVLCSISEGSEGEGEDVIN